MNESLGLVLHSAALLALFAALGSAPALLLGRGLRARAALAPIAGLALAAALLSSALAVMPAGTAAFAVLLPAALASLACALVAARGVRPSSPSSLWIPALLALAALVLALAPGLARESAGPSGLGNFDALLYAPGADWARDHTLSTDLSPERRKLDISEATGRSLVECGCRLGVATLGGAGAALLGVGGDLISLPLLAALFALGPLGIWFVARNLGLAAGPSAFGAAFGLSPALLLLVTDSTLGNLAGLAVAPAAVLVGVVAAGRPQPRILALGAVLFAGTIALYPEFALTLAAIAAAGLGGAALLRLRGREPLRPWLWQRIWPLAAIGLGGAALAPVATVKGGDYLRLLGLKGFEVELPRYLGVDDIGSWLFGVQHLYELQRFGELGVLKTGVAVALPLALAALALLGALRGGRTAALVCATPLAVSAALAAYVFLRYDECQYCLWKALTFALPFLAVALAAGAAILLAAARRRGGVAPLALAAFGAVALAALARSDLELTRATYRTPARTAAESRQLGAEVRALPEPRPGVLLEGAEATVAPLWTLPEAYGLIAAGDARISIDPGSLFARVFALDLDLPARPGLYDPGYGYVVTTFPGVRSPRRPLASADPYTLMRRAPLDVAVVRPGWALDQAEGAAAIPWLQGRFQLWVSGPRPGPVAVRLGWRGGGDGRLTASQGGRAVAVRASRHGACLQARLRAGRAVLEVDPHLRAAPGKTLFPAVRGLGIGVGTPLDRRLRPTESDPIPPPPKLLGLAALRAEPGRCDRRQR